MAIDYDSRAATYDATRSASPSIVRPLLRALGPANGRALLDIGGGTGNYAVALRDAGFRVWLSDVST
ncbi:MAG: methyltransferase type 11, partial [Dehalococcoidia bacterium]|nr:methyltransferase type 11 [Dehalococcoidia bacterium]